VYVSFLSRIALKTKEKDIRTVNNNINSFDGKKGMAMISRYIPVKGLDILNKKTKKAPIILINKSIVISNTPIRRCSKMYKQLYNKDCF